MIQDIVFGLFGLIVVVGGLGAVAFRNVFYNALCLILCLFGVAGLFIFLNCEFLAIIEVIIYIGAISVAIIFAIMLSQTMYRREETPHPVKFSFALGIAALLFITLTRLMRSTVWPVADVAGDYSIRALGKAFLTTALVPFEAVSLILLVAIIGALVIADKGGKA